MTTPSQPSEENDDWKAKLSPEQYQVCRLKATEIPFSGKYYKTTDAGEYVCVACGQVLFTSDTKFDSGTGWPSFSDVAAQGTVKLIPDESMGMQRMEAVCSQCDSHLGHVFDDGPTSTGKRYCINSLSLDFKPGSQTTTSTSTSTSIPSA